MLPWQQLLPDTLQNLTSSRSSWGKHPLKIWSKSVQGFRLWNTHKLYARRHCPDGAGDDYNPSLYGLGLKSGYMYVKDLFNDDGTFVDEQHVFQKLEECFC